MKRIAASIIAAICIATGLIAPAHAAAATVTTCADSGPGSLRAALAATTAAVTITVTPTCNGDNAITLVTTLDFPAVDVTLDGGAAVRTVIRRANGFTGTLLNLGEASAHNTVRNLTVDGNNIASDMQIMNAGGLLLDHFAMVRGKSTYAGIFNAAGSLTITGSWFTDNAAYSLDISDTASTAVLYSSSDQPVTVAASTFSRNTGCVADDAHCYFSAAINSETSLTISASTFDNNHGYFGAIKMGETVSLSLTNSTLFNNHAQDGGGAVYLTKGSVVSSTFAANNSTNNAQALFVNLLDDADTPPSFAGSIIIGDGTHSDCSPLTDLGANLVTDAGCITASAVAGGSQVVTTAQLDLQPLALNTAFPTNTSATQTMATGATSIARDYFSIGMAGFTGSAPTTDQRGMPRPNGAKIDVGAYEYGIDPPPVCPVVLKRRSRLPQVSRL